MSIRRYTDLKMLMGLKMLTGLKTYGAFRAERIGRRIRQGLDHLRGLWTRIVALTTTPKDSIEAEAMQLEQRGDFAGALIVWRKKLNGADAGSRDIPEVHDVHLHVAKLARLSRQWQVSARGYLGVLAADPHDNRAKHGLKAAAMRGAREAQADGDLATALKFWEEYASVDPRSGSARRGIEKCLLSLARSAEAAGYITRSRGYWAALLKRVPTDPRAKKGLARTGGRFEAS